MHILLLSDGTEKPGGWQTYTRDLAQGLRNQGHTVTVTTDLGSPISFLTNPLQSFFGATKLKKTLRDHTPDIVHITVEPYAMMMPFLGKEIAKKTVLTIHGSYGVRPLQGWNRLLAKQYYKTLKQCITVSQYTKKRVIEELQKTCGDHLANEFERKTTVIPNAVRLPVSPGAKKESDVKQIISVGGIKPRKGIVESLQAIAAYRTMGDIDVHFSIYGPYKKDGYYEKVQNTIYGLSLGDKVTIAGNVSEEELRSAYASSDLYLMPAKTTHDAFEGFGLVYLEANAYGVPCIGPETSGAAEAILEGETGFHINPQDPQQIAEKMKLILEEGAIKEENCRAFAQKHSIEKMTEKVLEIYHRLQAS